MTVDERLRSRLRDAATGPPIEMDDALRTVHARLDAVDLEDRAQPRARGPRLVAVLAGCTLLAGAVVLPIALQSSRDRAPVASSAPGRCGHTLTKGYRSTAVVRIAESISTPLSVPYPEFPKPVPAALGLCDSVLSRVHPKTDDVQFAAQTDAHAQLLSLTVSTPSRDDPAALARAWALAFRAGRLATAQQQIIERQRTLTGRVRSLHDELRQVDTELAMLMPEVYGDLPRIDAPLGHTPDTVPPIPETGSADLLNLAFERVSLLNELKDAGAQAATLRITRVKPQVFATLISVSAPVRFPSPSDHSPSAGVLLAIGLIAGGVALGAAGFLLGRRSRRAQSS
jgi:hypothetical protein